MPVADATMPGGAFLLHETMPEAVFTPEEFTPEQRMLAQAAEAFARGEVLPRSEAIERQEEGLSRTLLEKAGALGLLAADIPPEYGGLGLEMATSALLGERMWLQASFVVTYGAHTGIGTLPIVYFGTEAQRRQYLPGLATGSTVGAYALSEADSGSDALAAKTRAVKNAAGTHYVLSGTKMWTTNAAFADLFVLFAKVDGEHFTAFLVERDSPGLSTGREEHKLGIKGSSTRRVILEDVPVPVENVLGEVGRGHVVALNILNMGRFKLAANVLGGAKGSLATSARYAKERRQFGRPIADFGLIRHKLAEMATRLFAVESAVYRTAGLIDARLHETAADRVGALEEYAVECSILKVAASEMLDYVVDEALQIHGGYGYTEEFPAARAYRDARINRIFEGTNEINRLFVPTMLMRRAQRGRLPLVEVTTRLQRELMEFAPEPETVGPLAAERAAVANGKKLALLVAGAAVQRFGDAILEQQEILAAVSDMIMDLFVAESAILRAQKRAAEGKGDAVAGDLQSAMASVFVNDAVGRLEAATRQVTAALAAGDELRSQLAVLRRFTRWTPLDTITLRRRIAAAALEREGYPA
jgi:alkylation response protein AidB-like acyl-CoA dehydrogenase